MHEIVAASSARAQFFTLLLTVFAVRSSAPGNRTITVIQHAK